MKKVLLTATVQSHIAQFHKPLIKMLKENGYEVHVAARDNLAEKNGLLLKEPDKVFNVPFDRSPISKNNIKAYKELNKILSKNNYSIVHCNTPMGGIVTRLAAQKYRKNGTKIFYTAHGFHFYKGAPLKNWLIYYPVEKWFAKYTDKLITISYEDFNIATKKKFNTKIEHIHGVGANTEKYFNPTNEMISELRFQEGYDNNDFICICSGELNINKNQSTIIKAIPKVVEVIPKFKLLIAGNGPMKEKLEELIVDNNLEKHVKLIGYRTDLEKFVKMSDIVVSASLREGLGLNLIEAMLCGKPVVGSKNRGHNELIYHMENGMLVEAMSYDEFSKAILGLYEDKRLRNSIGMNALEISQKYAIYNVKNELEFIYELL